jgi:hypothetical protein
VGPGHEANLEKRYSLSLHYRGFGGGCHKKRLFLCDMLVQITSDLVEKEAQEWSLVSGSWPLLVTLAFIMVCGDDMRH